MRRRPSKYKVENCDEIIKFFDHESVKIKTVTRTFKNGSVRESKDEMPAEFIQIFFDLMFYKVLQFGFLGGE